MHFNGSVENNCTLTAVSVSTAFFDGKQTFSSHKINMIYGPKIKLSLLETSNTEALKMKK